MKSVNDLPRQSRRDEGPRSRKDDGPRWRQGGAVWLTGRAGGSTLQGVAGDLEAQGGSEQLGGATEERAEWLKGASGDRPRNWKELIE